MSSVTEIGHSDHDIDYPAAVPFVLAHVGCLAAFWSGVTWRALAICLALYWIRIFAIGAGYHRYFSHRAYSTGRAFQFCLAFLAQSSAQSSVLWWAAKHRQHHRYSDTAQDTHSPGRQGLIYSHVGWIFDRKNRTTDLTAIDDLARYPELRWLHRFELVPALLIAAFCFLLAGWPGVVVGFLWSTVLLYHATFCINSLAHRRGKRRYVTGDDSRNNWILALLTMGEGWHNNHHAYQRSVRQGFRWWEIDPTYYILRALSWTGLVWDLKTPPEEVLRNEQRLGARVVDRAAEQLAAHFNVDRIVRTIQSALRGPEHLSIQDALRHARDPAQRPAISLHLPEFPSREEIMRRAEAMFAPTRSLDQIVDRAYEHLLDAVGARLALSARQSLETVA
jgi:stearoyl-CoA desaturase (Delta-9 desaturase)